jgi:hypothetical protein
MHRMRRMRQGLPQESYPNIGRNLASAIFLFF